MLNGYAFFGGQHAQRLSYDGSCIAAQLLAKGYQDAAIFGGSPQARRPHLSLFAYHHAMQCNTSGMASQEKNAILRIIFRRLIRRGIRRAKNPNLHYFFTSTRFALPTFSIALRANPSTASFLVRIRIWEYRSNMARLTCPASSMTVLSLTFSSSKSRVMA